MKITVLTNIFNEEYLLPFWLEHHKNIFDHGIVVDYNSTDNSVEIIRKICPTWDIITTKNKYFGADEIDNEFMELENNIDGYKIVLNTTEFLITNNPLHDILVDYKNSNYSIQCLSVHSSEEDYYPSNLKELFVMIETVELTRRLHRSIHSYPNGKYTPGRHYATLPITSNISAYILWFGFYPWNNKLIKRKTQIKTMVPDYDKVRGFGSQHLWDIEEMNRQKNIYQLSSTPIEYLPELKNMLIKLS
jgi:hypothetical protein